MLQDSGFEATAADATTNPFWDSSSILFGSAFCTVAACGDGGGIAGPHNGTYWVWFGGHDGSAAETATVSQSVNISSGATATLYYYLWISAVASPFTDTLTIKVDGTTVQTINEPSVADSNYTLRSVNLNAYADGAQHTILFEYNSPDAAATFNVDDITLNVVCPPLPTPTPSQLANISTRDFVQTGNNVTIGGFIVEGSGAKKVIIRGLGPTLANFGLHNALADPTLELRDHTGALVTSNDNWKDSQQAEIQATNLAPPNDAESAILATLQPDAYTAIMRGKNNGTGVGLVEVYDLDPSGSSKLANISTRALVQTGNNVLIGGLIVNGSAPANVIVRAIGPTLTNFGIRNPLQDPLLELRDSNGNLFASNDNWRSTQEAQIIATGRQPPNDAEPAIAATLSPGAYTAIVRGTNNSIGVALVEAYYLDRDTAYFPPYFTTNGAFGAPAHGPFPVVLPDGTLLSDGTDQLIVFLDSNATPTNMQAVASAISNANATVVGQIASLHELQVQMHDVSQASSLIATLEATAGVISATPNLFVQPDQCSASANGVQGVNWTVADNVAVPTTSTSDVIIGVLDCFDPQLANAQGFGGNSKWSHGEVVEAFLKDASGVALSSKVTRVAETCSRDSSGKAVWMDTHAILTAAANFVLANPGKKIVFNASMGAGGSPVLAEHEAWYAHFKFLSQALAQQFGDRVVFVKSGGNANVNMPMNSRLIGCNFVSVGGLDEDSSTTATKAGFSNNGPVITTFAPALGVTPDASFSPEEFCGTSFAAPQVAGQLAAIWAKNPSLSPCQLTNPLANLPAVNGFKRFDGKQLEDSISGQSTSYKYCINEWHWNSSSQQWDTDLWYHSNTPGQYPFPGSPDGNTITYTYDCNSSTYPNPCGPLCGP